MVQTIQMHPINPQPRLLQSAVAIIRSGGVIVYPTDSCYALGCHMGGKSALKLIQQIRP